MPIEILAYSPTNVQEFIDFSINGVPNGQGGFETDEMGRPLIGVLRWLHGRRVPRARFFTTPPNHPMKLLMSVLERLEPSFVPWMSTIPGIVSRIQTEGQIGELQDFPDGISGLLGAVVPNQQLDEAFLAGRERVQSVLRQIEADPGRLMISQEDVIKSLKDGSNVDEVFAEVHRTLRISL